MPKGDATKKLLGTDLSSKYFLWTDSQPSPKFWLLPVLNPTSAEKTRAMIQRNIDNWESIKKHIPITEQQRLRWELEGAAISRGIALPEVILSDDEVQQMLAERFAAKMLELCELDALYR